MVHPSYVSAAKWDVVYKGKPMYSIVDKRIIIWNGNTTRIVPKAILVSGYFEDPTEWAGLEICDSNGNGNGVACTDALDAEFPIDDDLVDAAYTMVLDKLRLTLSVPADRINQQA